jgi:hypothetical protein
LRGDRASSSHELPGLAVSMSEPADEISEVALARRAIGSIPGLPDGGTESLTVSTSERKTAQAAPRENWVASSPLNPKLRLKLMRRSLSEQ